MHNQNSEQASYLSGTQGGKKCSNSGFVGVDSLSGWGKFEQQHLVNCYFDKDSNLFYIHNGLEIKKSGRLTSNILTLEIKTALGVVLISKGFFNMSVLELEINALNNKSYMIQWFNKFRPQDNEMNAMISLLPNNISKDLKIIHGHNDNYEYDINRHLFNLNARDKSINNNSGYSPVAIKIQH